MGGMELIVILVGGLLGWQHGTFGRRELQFMGLVAAGWTAVLTAASVPYLTLGGFATTLAYTAVVLANVSSLSLGTPRYDRAQLTTPGGFNGRDGVFRFLQDGRSEYALVIKKVTVGGAQLVDGPKI